MKTMKTILEEEVKMLRKVKREAEKRLKNAPDGNLRVENKTGRSEYYYRAEGNERKNGRYLKKDELDVATRIAQRDYDRKIVKLAEERIRAISIFLEKYERTSLKKLYENTKLGRKNLISAEVVSDEEYARQWQEVKYKGKKIEGEMYEIVTEQGERVRSKSEKIIADKLYRLGIPYRYECPLVLKENIMLHPDFTILKLPERKEVYLEHFGMMDDPAYAEQAIRKLALYERNGIYLGVNLFVTFEDSKRPLSVRALSELLGELFVGE